MFCKKCGKELAEDAVFCPVCGTRKMEIRDGNSVKDVGTYQDRYDFQDTGTYHDRHDSQSAGVNLEGMQSDTEGKREELKTDKSESGRSIISRIWNSQLFLKIAIKFGNILEILEGIIFLILSRFLFKEGGLWGSGFGILFGLGGIGSCISGVAALLSRRKNDANDEVLDEADINKKKRNLCIGIVGIVIALIILKSTGGGTYSIVKAISFDNIGPATIGELVDENIKSPEWSQKKLDSDSKLVYVEGYCPNYGETIRIEFYYEKLKDGSHEVTLNGMYWPESDEEFNAFETAVVWATFYDYEE